MTLQVPEWLARGEPFILHGKLSNVVPDRAELRLAVEGAPNVVHAMAVTRGDTMGTFGLRLEANRVSRTFRYQVQANDVTTAWRTVPVLPPPELIDRDGRPSPQVTVSFPAYTDRPVIESQPGRSRIDGVTVACAVIRAATDRPIARAWMELSLDSPARSAAALAALALFNRSMPITRMADDGRRCAGDDDHSS